MIIQPNDIDNEVAAIVDKIYPVGSIYMSISSTSPATLFGGTWEQITNRFLLSAGSSYTAGATGGEATHTLTVAEMPTHNHRSNSDTSSGTTTTSSSGSHSHNIYMAAIHPLTTVAPSGGAGVIATSNPGTGTTSDAGSHTHTVESYARGSGTAHNNMPPYLVVYMWKRTA